MIQTKYSEADQLAWSVPSFISLNQVDGLELPYSHFLDAVHCVIGQIFETHSPTQAATRFASHRHRQFDAIFRT